MVADSIAYPQAQMDLYAVESLEQKVTLVAYTNMIKASWILIDIIARHPQMPFLSATAHAEVQILSTVQKHFVSQSNF